MKNRPQIIIFVSLVLVITGCNFNFLPSAPMSIDFRTGTLGLEVNIDGKDNIMIYGASSSTKETYIIRIENKGATSIKDDGFYMRFHLSEDYLITEDKKNNIILEKLSNFNARDILEGKTKYSKSGDKGEYLLVLQGAAPPNQGATAKISLDVCYRYETVLADSICINTKFHENKDKGCKKNEYSYSQGQGAPIKISKIEVKESAEESGSTTPSPTLVITIENPKGGIFSLPEGEKYKEGCLQKKEINQLKIEEARLGTYDLKCDGIKEDKKVEFSSNERKIVCSLPKDNKFEDPEGSLQTVLYIKLEYGYHQNEEKTINIVRENYDK
jgi:hypothetical protein